MNYERGVDTIDTVYLCRTMSDNEFENQDEPDRRSETNDDSDTDSVAELEYKTWKDACAWEFRSASGNDSPRLFQNPPTDIIQNIYRQSDTDSAAELEYDTWNDACAWKFQSVSGNDSPGLFQNPPTVTIQNIYRQSETDDDSDTDSTAELECDTWNDACTWEFRSTSGNDSPGLIQNPPTDIIQNTWFCTDDDEYLEKLGNGGYVDGDIQYPRVCVRNNDNRLYPKLTGCCHTDDMDFMSLAACYDCTCLMSLI